MIIVRKLRLEKGWSQEQLAEICNLSVRTIQRIERGRKPSLETQKSLAAAFDLDLIDLTRESEMTEHTKPVNEEERAILYVRDIKGFYSHLLMYVLVAGGLCALNLIRNPDRFWALWPAIGWGLGVVFHGLNVFEVFNLFGPNWEKRQIDKRLGRKR